MLFNYVGSPALKWLFLVEALFTFYCVVVYRFNKILIPLLAFYLIEGQGRILWGLTPFTKLLFDIVMIVALLKSIAINRKLIQNDKIPMFFLALMALHFLWYIIQLANLDSVGFFGVLATSKIYIFPLLVFFMFLVNPLDFESTDYHNIRRFVIYLIITQGILIIVQMNVREDFLYRISPYYRVTLRADFEQFIGTSFRPPGTTHVPGLTSLYFLYIVGFLFMKPLEARLRKIIVAILIVLIAVSGVLTQVRSALVKFAGVILLINWSLYFAKKHRFKTFLQAAALSLILGLFLYSFPGSLVDKYMADETFGSSIIRATTILDPAAAAKSRSGLDTIINITYDKISNNPFGLGPGRTGAAALISLDKIKDDPIYSASASWSYENIFVSLAIDLGVGMLFYSLLIVFMPLVLVYYSFNLYFKKEWDSFRPVMVSSIITFVILIGNWAAPAIPYNPESFAFWLWLSIGYNAYYQHKKKIPT